MSKLNKIKRFILIIVSGGFLFVCFVICWYRFAWPRYIDKSKIIQLADEINNSDALPKDFYLIYDELYPNHRETKITKTFFLGSLRTLFSKHVPPELISPTRYINHFYFLSFPTDNELRIKKDFPIYFTFAINKYTDPEKCFDYYINHYDFLYGRIGIDSASNGYYNKEFDELTQDEKIGLIVMLENSALYNPKRFPDRHKRKVNELKNKLSN